MSPTPEGHEVGAQKRLVLGNTILNQPYRRRVLTDRLSRDDSQLAAFLEGELGPTPAGQNLPHSYPETIFRREKCGQGNTFHSSGQTSNSLDGEIDELTVSKHHAVAFQIDYFKGGVVMKSDRGGGCYS